jgi:hypothetical protein
MIPSILAINILGNALAEAQDRSFLPRLYPYQVQACQKLGPTILLYTTKTQGL